MLWLVEFLKKTAGTRNRTHCHYQKRSLFVLRQPGLNVHLINSNHKKDMIKYSKLIRINTFHQNQFLICYLILNWDLLFVLSKITENYNFHEQKKTDGTQVFHLVSQGIKRIRLTRTIQFIRTIKTVSFSVANLLFHDTVPIATSHCTILSLPVRIIVLNQTVVVAVTVELVVPIVILMFF